MRHATRAGIIVGLSILLGGCSPSVSGDGFDLAEWEITGPAELMSGADSVTVANLGSRPHTLVVTDSSGTVVAATELIQPGDQTELALDLDQGEYSFTCRIVTRNSEGNLVDHFEAGMNTLVSVRA